jgi:sterol desaturase/sphingolipid hydroxylase (fatty acid hydroxylase superfamily)
MLYLISFVAGGLVLQLLSRFWPVRAFDREPEYAVDALALVVALASQVAIVAVAYPWISSIQDVPFVKAGVGFWYGLSPLAAGLAYFLLMDFLAYWFHRLNHVPLLWSTHAFHHSPRNLNWASGMRGSPMHFVVLGVPSLALQVFYSPEGAVLAAVTAYGAIHNSLIHSNVRVPTRQLNWIFVTGRSHFVHHGRDPHLGGSNFGFLFTFWDRIFGTWVEPDSLPADFPLGLPYEIDYPRLVVGLPAPSRAD